MTPVRLLLNSDFTGANAFFALAAQTGLFRAAGLDMQFTPGRGAYTAAGRLQTEGFDAAYGDLNALIEMAQQQPADDLPVAVLVVHRHAPSCITVARDSPVRGPRDRAGRTVCGHASDVALRTFGAYAHRAGLDAAAVRVTTSDAPMRDLLQEMLKGTSDGVFGYLTTHTAALAGAGLVADTTVRFLPYRAVCSDLVGSGLMVSPRFLRDAPAAVVALVQATHAGILGAAAEPLAAIDAVQALQPAMDRPIELARWLGTLQGDIGADMDRHGRWVVPELVGDRHLDAAIDCLAAASGWQHTPPRARIFRQILHPASR